MTMLLFPLACTEPMERLLKAETIEGAVAVTRQVGLSVPEYRGFGLGGLQVSATQVF